MNWKKVKSVFHKELKETLRDQRTLAIMILVPILLYPLLFIVMMQIMAVGTQQLESENSRVAVLSLPVRLNRFLHDQKQFEFYDTDNPEEALQSKQIHAYLAYEKGRSQDSLFIYFDGASDRSRLAWDRLGEVLIEFQDDVREKRLRRLGIAAADLEAFGLESVNTAPPSRMGGMFLGSIIPFILIVTLVLGAMYPAIDLTAGEKERGTLETVLSVPVKRIELLTGKYLTVTVITVITGILNLVSMSMAYLLGLIQIETVTGNIEIALSPVTLLVLFLIVLSLSMFISATILSVCLFARSFKDAQNLVTPLLLLIMFPAMVVMAPGFELKGIIHYIPILNISLLFKEVLLQHFVFESVFQVLMSTSVYALLAVVVFAKLFDAEQVLFAEGKGWQLALRRSKITPAQAFQPSSALVILAVLLLLLLYVGSTIQLRYKHWGVLGTQWLLFFIPVLAAAAYFKVDIKKLLHLKGFGFTAFLGTLLLVLGGLGFTTWIAQLQAQLFPESLKVSEMLEELINLESFGLSPLVALLIFAVSPAVCEEVVFRGMLLSSFRKHLSAPMTVGIVALLFGLFHLNIFRLIPTALIGLFLTYIVYQTGSIYLSMIGHGLINGLAVLLVSYPAMQRYLFWLHEDKPFNPSGMAVMAVLLVSGITLIRFSKRKERIT